MKATAIRILYAEIIGISREDPFSLPLLQTPHILVDPTVHRRGFPFSLSRPGFLALQLERLAASSETTTKTTFVDDETSTFLRLYPREITRNPGFPRKLSSTALAHPFLSSAALSVLSTPASCSFAYSSPPPGSLALSLSLFDPLAFA